MKTSLIYVLIMTLAVFNATIELTGKWETKPSAKGNITRVVFKPDNSFEGYINRKPFVSGNYTIRDSIFSFVDNGCQGMRGTYKIILFNNADSLRFECIIDSCAERRDGMKNLVLGRVK